MVGRISMGEIDGLITEQAVTTRHGTVARRAVAL